MEETAMKKFIRHIDMPSDTVLDIENKRAKVNEIESWGFQCSFVPDGIDIYATEVQGIFGKILTFVIGG